MNVVTVYLQLNYNFTNIIVVECLVTKTKYLCKIVWVHQYMLIFV